jgi:hypothetical protein
MGGGELMELVAELEWLGLLLRIRVGGQRGGRGPIPRHIHHLLHRRNLQKVEVEMDKRPTADLDPTLSAQAVAMVLLEARSQISRGSNTHREKGYGIPQRAPQLLLLPLPLLQANQYGNLTSKLTSNPRAANPLSVKRRRNEKLPLIVCTGLRNCERVSNKRNNRGRESGDRSKHVGARVDRKRGKRVARRWEVFPRRRGERTRGLGLRTGLIMLVARTLV